MSRCGSFESVSSRHKANNALSTLANARSFPGRIRARNDAQESRSNEVNAPRLVVVEARDECRMWWRHACTVSGGKSFPVPGRINEERSHLTGFIEELHGIERSFSGWGMRLPPKSDLY
jgi:hypothetical protein